LQHRTKPPKHHHPPAMPIPTPVPVPVPVPVPGPAVHEMPEPAPIGSGVSMTERERETAPSSPRSSLPPFSCPLSTAEEDTLRRINWGYHARPQPKDTYEPSLYKARAPYPTPKCFPSERRRFLDSASIFSVMDLDTLFFAFYFERSSYQQFLAAKELKVRGWSFNTRYSAWFQRHFNKKSAGANVLNEMMSGEVKSLKGAGQHLICEAQYERGTYIFFDRSQSWQMRMRENFKFDYAYLEDDANVNVDEKLDWNKLATYGNGCGLIAGEHKQMRRYQMRKQQQQMQSGQKKTEKRGSGRSTQPTRPPSSFHHNVAGTSVGGRESAQSGSVGNGTSNAPPPGRLRPPMHYRQSQQYQSRR